MTPSLTVMCLRAAFLGRLSVFGRLDGKSTQECGNAPLCFLTQAPFGDYNVTGGHPHAPEFQGPAQFIVDLAAVYGVALGGRIPSSGKNGYSLSRRGAWP